ncbi:hypothetical protein ALC53_05231 [Atta colombica]|uniref:Uncharacterized protein n=1 Tax=Atta colombica TaxID=520822 RepID=A0A195BHZ4_9HYME|nr:hypothetical protein ALC53_05231 [Atta colombica]
MGVKKRNEMRADVRWLLSPIIQTFSRSHRGPTAHAGAAPVRDIFSAGYLLREARGLRSPLITTAFIHAHKANRRISISARSYVTIGSKEGGGDRTEAGCKPLNNSSRGDRWVACRSFLLARPIKARGSDSSSHLHLSFDHHHHHHHRRRQYTRSDLATENADQTKKGTVEGSRGTGKRENSGPRDVARSVDFIDDGFVESIAESISPEVPTGQDTTTLAMRSRLARVGDNRSSCLSLSLVPCHPLITYRSKTIITGEFVVWPVWRPAARCLASLSAASPGSDERNL